MEEAGVAGHVVLEAVETEPVSTEAQHVAGLRKTNPRDIHLADRPAPEGLVGHIARPGGIKNCSPGRQKIKKPAHRYL